MVSKIVNRTQGWLGNLLSMGGKVVLIRSVLHSIPLHIISVAHPPKTILDLIEKSLANFFWGSSEGKRKYHWISWKKLCYPKIEGGVGFRSLHDICNTFAAKAWWNFRTQNSLLTKFLEAKYCKRIHAVARKKNYSQSHIWRRLMDARNDCEHNILWKVGNGNLSFWWDNWTNIGALAMLVDQSTHSKNTKVSDFINSNHWNTSKLHEILPSDLVVHILTIKIFAGNQDHAVWTPEHTGSFSSKSAWNALRQSNGSSPTSKNIWHTKLPFKISFHMLRLLNNKLATDDSLSRFGVQGPSKCSCCHNGMNEDINHLFSYGQIAEKVWKFFEHTLGLLWPNSDSIRTKLMRW